LSHGPKSIGTWSGRSAQGFDYTYDKRLYDRLREGHAGPCANISGATPEYQRTARPLSRKPRRTRAAATFSDESIKLLPSSHSFHRGLDFSIKANSKADSRRISPHLVRAPAEAVNAGLKLFMRGAENLGGSPSCDRDNGSCWNALPPGMATTPPTPSSLLAGRIRPADGCWPSLIFAAQPPLRPLPFSDLDGSGWPACETVLGDAIYQRRRSDLQCRGLYLDVAPWQVPRVFELKAASAKNS